MYVTYILYNINTFISRNMDDDEEGRTSSAYFWKEII